MISARKRDADHGTEESEGYCSTQWHLPVITPMTQWHLFYSTNNPPRSHLGPPGTSLLCSQTQRSSRPQPTMKLRLFILLLSSSVLVSRGHAVLNAAADAPGPSAASSSPPPPANLIGLMSKKGCKNFADLLTAGTGEAAKSFSDSVSGGLTVFCPNDGAIKGFAPKFKNLTADEKISLLLYHGVPVYYSLSSLKSSNGVMNTLATDGVAKNYNFTVQNNGEIVTIKSAGTTASIKKTVVDKDPLAVYSIDEVLEPAELFKPAEVPSPAPSPAEAADAPAEGKGKKKKHAASADAPAGPDGQPADQKAADENGGRREHVMWWALAAMAGVAVAA